MDHSSTYRYHKQVLQILQWKYPGQRWLLKSPSHLPAIDAIVKTYPDACIVHLHRDPVKAVTSWASLNLQFRGMLYPKVDQYELGRQSLERLASDMDRYLRDRPKHNPDQFLDIQYHDFIQNPIQSTKRIYDHFSLEHSGDFFPKAKQYLSQNPKNKHGKHSYCPEDFGLTADGIRSRFRNYSEQFLPKENVIKSAQQTT